MPALLRNKLAFVTWMKGVLEYQLDPEVWQDSEESPWCLQRLVILSKLLIDLVHEMLALTEVNTIVLATFVTHCLEDPGPWIYHTCRIFVVLFTFSCLANGIRNNPIFMSWQSTYGRTPEKKMFTFGLCPNQAVAGPGTFDIVGENIL